MKILELRFKNLNSLYGEWVIDFTNPEYVSSGIFVLTGPTGAGKSTVLDAICLALYGSTPRLGKITKSGNEIMSRQTGECYAEVLFESQTGQFRCHWEQRRARNKTEGNLQDQKHEIADANTGKPIETKKSLVSGVIEEKTGMDFDRFTRSILLAQGGFDTFLKADIEQKSKILEQITGTEIYSKISRRVHERQRDEQEKLKNLEAETSGIVTLEPEQEKELQQNIEDNLKQEAILAGKSSEANKAMTWLTAIEDLEKEIHSLTDEAAKLKADTEAFKPEQAKLERAAKAASLEGAYATLSALRKQQSDDQAALETKGGALPELENSVNTHAESLKASEQLTLKAKENLKEEALQIQKVRSLDQKIAEQEKILLKDTETCTNETTKIDADKKIWAEEQEKRNDAEKRIKTVEQYLKEHAKDEWLLSGLTGVEEQIDSLLDINNEIEKKKTDLKNADTAITESSNALDAATNQYEISKKNLDESTENLKQSKDVLSELLEGKWLREYRTEKETLLREVAYIKTIKKFEEHRSQLEDGKPCPLCGSMKHPFAEGNVPLPDETEQKIESLTNLITKAEDQEDAIKKREQVKVNALKHLHDCENMKTNTVNGKETAEKILTELKDALAKFRVRLESVKIAVLEKLQPLGIKEIQESEVPLLLDSLKSRLKVWQEQGSQKTEIEKQIVGIDSEMKRLDAMIETQVNALTEKSKNLEKLKEEYADGTAERNKLYGNKRPDEEETRLNKDIEDAEEAERKVRKQNSDHQEKLTIAKADIASLEDHIKQRTPGLKKAETHFSENLMASGFADEKLFFEARLTYEEQEILSSRAKELDNIGIEIKAKQKDRETRLATEKTKTLTDKTIDELTQQSRKYEECLKQLQDAIADLKLKLRKNMEAKEWIKEKQSAIEAQKKECHRWKKLHDLIGSADGKKYRNFAQGLTFELMVFHANQKLEKMTDRYLLIRDEQQPLELNVIDNYQAGEIRSTKNLSGGESFIVSLTLALGLSKMASRKVRVDSLFLDEGFGTLDEEALETALETLSGLQQDGKLIGIISHIPALKERISTQINIAPVSDGRSSLYGPGCKKVAKSE